ncbi:helix-turn-helix domain-containing protein [Pseudomonas luteola]
MSIPITADGFPERLKKARGLAGLTQSELAERVKTVPRQISVYESGTAMPRPKTLQKLAEVLHTSAEWLLEGSGTPPQLEHAEGTITLRKVPIIEWEDAWDVVNEYLEPELSKYIPNVARSSDKAFALIMNGESMIASDSSEPSFPPGTVVIFDPLQNVASGDFVLWAPNSSSGDILFRRYTEDGTQKYLVALSRSFPAIHIQTKNELIKAVASVNKL